MLYTHLLILHLQHCGEAAKLKAGLLRGRHQICVHTNINGRQHWKRTSGQRRCVCDVMRVHACVRVVCVHAHVGCVSLAVYVVAVCLCARAN